MGGFGRAKMWTLLPQQFKLEASRGCCMNSEDFEFLIFVFLVFFGVVKLTVTKLSYAQADRKQTL